MIYILAVIFIIVCVASVSYHRGAEHHDGYDGSYYKISHQKQWEDREMDK